MIKQFIGICLLMMSLAQANAQNIAYHKFYLSKKIHGSDSGQQSRFRELASKTLYLLPAQMLFFYTLTKLPRHWMNWDATDTRPKSWLRNWGKNITHAPLFDDDALAVNFIGHPLAGASYYVMARQIGYSEGKAFLYTVFQSTVIWEYGLEAFVETPSIQDMIVTPIWGAIWGELHYRQVQRIKAHGGRVLGSKILGDMMSVALSPMNAVSTLLRDITHDALNSSVLYFNYSLQPELHFNHQMQHLQKHGYRAVMQFMLKFN